MELGKLEKMECAGVKRFDVMSDLESGLNLGLYKLEQVVFLLRDLANLHKPEDGLGTISDDKIVRLQLDAERARILSNLACDLAQEAFSEFQDADESFGNLVELNRCMTV